jgi:hypothetical protein
MYQGAHDVWVALIMRWCLRTIEGDGQTIAAVLYYVSREDLLLLISINQKARSDELD